MPGATEVKVVCVRQGTVYRPEYVTALRRQVREHAGADLICLGDDVPLVHGFKGWWAKIELFAPEHEDLRPCFYLDLDTLIRRPIHDFLQPVEKLHLIRDFMSPHRSNSGLMLLPQNTSAIWHAVQSWRGPQVDGDFLMTQPHRILQDRFDGIVSYKRDCRQRPQGRIVCFHGRPKPHDGPGWVRSYWKHYAGESDGGPYIEEAPQEG